MQKITIVGNLGKDAVIRNTTGKDILTFNVAVTEKYKNRDGENVETVSWYGCMFRSTGLAAYLKKGDKVLVHGKLTAKTYVNDKRETVLDLSVSVDYVELLGSKKNGETQTENEQ